MPYDTDKYDLIFKKYAEVYGLVKGHLLLKSIAKCESDFRENAYRYEPGFWQKYLKNNPDWKDKDPALVSASYGLMQLMWTTAWALGFRGVGAKDLEDPDTNISLGAKLIRVTLDKVYETQACKCFRLTPIGVTLARYNGGSIGNPDENGNLRNFRYVDKVFKIWDEYKKKEQ